MRDKILWDSQTHHPILARRPHLVLVDKKEKLVKFSTLDYYRVKIKRLEKYIQIPGPCQRTEKVIKHEGDSNTNHSWSPRNNSRVWKRSWREWRSTEEMKPFRPQHC